MEIEEEIVERLINCKYTISTAESCTGGMIASTLINVSGVSAVMNEGFITYANSAKIKYLGVSEKTIEQYGVVSEQVVGEMVLGCVAASQSTIGIAVSGIAGPGGGSLEKPVGLVYIGCGNKDHLLVKELHLQGSRLQIRTMTTKLALQLAAQWLKEDGR